MKKSSAIAANTGKNAAITAGFFLLSTPAYAQFASENFRNAAAPGWQINGSAQLTAATKIDTEGDGWLRLTSNTTFSVGQALYERSFTSNEGIVAKFDYVMWDSSPGGAAADGISFFLYDASVENPMGNAGNGPGLGYCRGNGGLLGVGLDGEIGNFVRKLAGADGFCLTGVDDQLPNSITIRGPVSDNNPFIGTPTSPDSLIYNKYARSRPAATRSVQVALLPSAAGGYYVTLDEGLTGGSLTRLISGNYSASLPDTLSIGFAGGTGQFSQVNEVRITSVTKPIDIRISTTAPVVNNNTVSHTFTLHNDLLDGGAANPIIHTADAPLLSDTTDPALRNIRWTCVAEGTGTTCPADRGTGAIQNLGNYLLGTDGRLIFTVSGTVACATDSEQSHTVTAAFPPTSDFEDLTPADSTATASGMVQTTSCTAPTPVPFLGSFALALLSMMAAGLGAIGLYRRKWSQQC